MLEMDIVNGSPETIFYPWKDLSAPSFTIYAIISD